MKMWYVPSHFFFSLIMCIYIIYKQILIQVLKLL
jgi:hypothetical protein